MIRASKRSLFNKQGYNLIEAAIVLGVAGLIVAGVFAAWNAVSTQSKLRRAQDQVTVIVNQVRTTYGNRNTLDTATGSDFTNALISAGLMPDSWLTDAATNTVGNPYGGNIIVAPDSMPSSSSKDALTITFNKIPRTDCYKLAASMLGAGRAQGLFKIGSTTVTSTSKFDSIKSSICTTTSLSLTFSLKSGT